MSLYIILFLLLLFATLFVSVKKNKLTLPGALIAALIGGCIFAGAGFTGIAMTGLFFLLATLATSWKSGIKKLLGAADEDTRGRSATQVMANGGVAAITGLLCILFPDHQHLFRLMMAAALSSATADTLSSELGTVYGKRFYNILNFKKDRRGENGVISMEGILTGITGSIIIAGVYVAGFGWSSNFAVIILSGTMGNITDSILGATLERKKYLDNNAVNFINTVVAAFIALILMYLL